MILVVLPTVTYGGASLPELLLKRAPGYLDNPLGEDLFRAGLLPAGFFFSILSPSETVASRLIYLCFAGAVVLAAGLLTVGIGLFRQ